MDTYSLRSVFDLPIPFRSTFNFRYFNSLQSECFHTCFQTDVNMVVSAPTGSGKTVLFELCILKLLSKFLSRDGRFVHIKGTLKTIYVAPSKALVQEKLRDWSHKFGSLGVICLELTSDNDSYNAKNIHEADIVLTTPEKFDAVTRYRMKNGGLSFFSDIALLLLDEVHLLNDPRGAALEAIVSRMKMLSCRSDMKHSPLAHIRFIAVSATIPNLEDLAEWLMVPPQGMKRFGEEMRPVKLTTKVFGYAAAKNDFMFEKRLQNYIFDILMQYSRGKSALVFCATRKGAQEAAQKISQAAMSLGYSNPFIKSIEQHERLREASLACSDKQLQSYIIYGVGYHNGGLCMKDRNLIENLFLSGDVQVLCTTNTLAHGINLPAHTVVIKSTQHFNKEKGLYTEYDRSTILQMSGRAGRPPFNDTGTVIIMTRKETVHLYENFLNGCETVESQLLSCMTEHLTAEIVQLTVPDITMAIEWMKCSYLYVRMKKNPENYGVKKGISKDRIERHMHEVCVQKVNELSKYQMIWTDEDGFLLQALEPGKLMTNYYLKFDTMRYIMQTSNFGLEDVLHTVCRAEELSWIQLRRNEKKLLNDINVDKDGRLRFHICGGKGKRQKRIQSREEKIFVLANDCLTGDPLVHDLSLSQDMNSICANGSRVAKCMKDYFLYKKNYKGVLHSSTLAKSLHQKLWDDSPYQLKQLPGIGMVTAKALHSMGVISFDTFAEADPRKIEIVTGRKYPFGNQIKESLRSLPPKVEMKIEVIESQRKGKLAITLNRLEQSSKRHYADMIVGLEEDNLIIYHEKIRLDEFSSPYSTAVFFSNTQKSKLTVKADLIFEEYVGIDLHHTLLVTNESNEDATPKIGGKKTSSFPHPGEVCIDEDEDESLLPFTLEKQNKSSEATTSMPTFELLNEELDEDECKIIDEKTVFDHIRRKAKDFPLLSTSDAINSPSAQASKLSKKRVHEMRLELRGLVEISEGSGRNTKPRHFEASLYPASTEADQTKHLIHEKANKQHMATRSLDIVSLLDDEEFSSAPQVHEDTAGSSSMIPVMPPQLSEDAPDSKVSSYPASLEADQTEHLIYEKATKQHMAMRSPYLVNVVTDDEEFSSVTPQVNEDTTGSSSKTPVMPPQVDKDATGSSSRIPVVPPQVNEDAAGSSSRIPAVPPQVNEDAKGSSSRTPAVPPQVNEDAKGSSSRIPVVPPRVNEDAMGSSSRIPFMPLQVNEDTTGVSSRIPVMPSQVNENTTGISSRIPVMPQENEDISGSSSRISSRKVESIFNRLRRKAHNFPIIDKPKTMQIESDPLTTDHSPDNKFKTSSPASHKSPSAPSNKTPSDTVTSLDLEPSETEGDPSLSLEGYTDNHHLSTRRSACVRRTLDLPFLSKASDSFPLCTSASSLLPTRDVPSQPAEHSVEPRSATHDQTSTGGVTGRSCSLATTAGESSKKVDSFLGFKSIFSFL